jgi:hypothetical protein
VGNALHTPGAPGVGAVTPAHARLADAGLLAVQGPTLIDTRTGILHGPGATALVTGTADTAPMAVLVAVHHWATSRGVASDGVYRGGLEVATRVSIDAAPGSGSRTDVVWVKQNDAHSTISPDATTEPVYGKTTGTVGGGKPAIPVGAEELATVEVSAGATATNGAGVTITNTARLTVARGAPIPVRSLAERDDLSLFDGLTVKRLDVTGAPQETWDGSWRRHAFTSDLPADSGWVNVTIAAGFAAQGTEIPQVRKIGNVVQARGGWSNTGMPDPNTTYSVGTIPAGYRPAAGYPVRGFPGMTSAGSTGRMVIDDSGAVTINTGGAVAGFFMMTGVFTWTVN